MTSSTRQAAARAEAAQAQERQPLQPARGVVVGYDGSPGSAPALAWAAAEAGRRGSPLTVLHANDFYGTGATLLGAAGMLEEEAQEQSLAVARQGTSQARTVADRLDVRPVSRLVDATTALVQASRTADLLVVGNRGRGALAGAVLGSVAFSVTAGARCPVVVVRGDAERHPGPEHPVVVGVDGSPAAGEAVRFAADVAERAGARLELVVAWRRPELLLGYGGVYDSAVTEEAQKAAQEIADEAGDDLRELRPDLETRVRVVHDAPAHALTAASEQAGLVVVGARGRGTVTGLFLGSVSHAVIHRSACPVAVVRSYDD